MATPPPRSSLFPYTTLFRSALGAAVGAIGGIIITPVTLTIYDAGTMLGLKGFAAAVTGGLGNTFGGIVGGFVLGLLEAFGGGLRSEEHTSELQSRFDLVCRL